MPDRREVWDLLDEIRRRGSAPLRERRAARRYSPLSARPNLGEGVPWRDAPRSDNAQNLIDSWRGSRGLGQRMWEARGGKTGGAWTQGKWAGYDTEGSMKAAVSGRARELDELDAYAAEMLGMGANDYLDQIGRGYDTARDDTYGYIRGEAGLGLADDDEIQRRFEEATKDRTTSTDALLAKHDAVLGRAVSGEDARNMAQARMLADAGELPPAPGRGGHHPMSGRGTIADQREQYARDEALKGLERQQAIEDSGVGLDAGYQDALGTSGKEYEDYLANWAAMASDPALQTLDLADAMGDTPMSEYQLAAASELGVEPYYALGTWGDKTDLADFKLGRDMEAIDLFGMPYSEAAGEIEQLGNERAAAERDYLENRKGMAEDEAAALEDAAKEDEALAQQMIAREIYNRTGIDAGQFDGPPEQVLEVLGSPTYQTANEMMLEAQAAADIQGTFDAYRAASDDPAVLSVWLTQWKDYLPQDIDLELYDATSTG